MNGNQLPMQDLLPKSPEPIHPSCIPEGKPTVPPPALWAPNLLVPPGARLCPPGGA